MSVNIVAMSLFSCLIPSSLIDMCIGLHMDIKRRCWLCLRVTKRSVLVESCYWHPVTVC